MATLAAATTERDRLMRAYVGVSARVVPGGGAFQVEVHDVRGSEVKTSAQEGVLEAVGAGSPGAFESWSPAQEPSVYQTVYP